MDDAIYLGYPGASPREVKKIDSRVRGGLVFFDLVLTSNELIREDLGLGMDPRCIVYPGPSPDAAFTGVQGDLKEKVVLWLGSPSTISNVESILPGVVEQLPDVRILIVGSPNDGPQLGSIRRQRWTTEVESKALRCSWSGLMPLQVSAWNQRKAGYKILEYLSYGVVPVVQDSPIVRTLLGRRTSELCELVSGDTPQDWAAAIQRSLDRTTDQTWIEGRDAVFETWSSVGFSRLIISAKSSGGSFE
ncbi:MULTISPECIES: glycosyltransferase [Arthrobacter]|uniref:glycosyltransferase n=1 Tax=Arthrobacter TaxID=1663 RepID=UPI0014049D87|nr:MULTISPECIES: glycosyltransferase [Arthrobacter]MBT8159261.1 glycosyltransferase [Arthrobacter sp. GN70]